jgi:hypothetical protein
MTIKPYANRWKKDLPNVIRRQLQELCQLPDESLEEYAERAQDLASDGYPETPENVIQIIASDAPWILTEHSNMLEVQLQSKDLYLV